MPVTPEVLISRLMEVYEAPSREALAQQLGMPVRSLARLAAGKGASFARTVHLLDKAGWLNVTDDPPQHPVDRDPLEAIAGGVERLLASQQEMMALVRQVLPETEQAPDRGRRPRPPTAPRSMSR